MFFAFALDSPHGLMISRICASESFAISLGVSASSKSRGDTSLTRLSVHCADSITATRNVKSLRLSSGTVGFGKASSSFSITKSAL